MGALSSILRELVARRFPHYRSSISVDEIGGGRAELVTVSGPGAYRVSLCEDDSGYSLKVGVCKQVAASRPSFIAIEFLAARLNLGKITDQKGGSLHDKKGWFEEVFSASIASMELLAAHEGLWEAVEKEYAQAVDAGYIE